MEIWNEIVKNEELMNETASLTPAEAAAVFQAKGYNVTEEDVAAVGEIIGNMIRQKNGELNNEDLDRVAGGLTDVQYLALQGALVAGGWWCLAAAAPLVW